MIPIGIAAAGSLSPTEAPGLADSEADSGFRVSTPAGRPAIAPETPPLPASAVAPGLILALQEQMAATVGRRGASDDRDARRRGKELIEALGALQRALLSGAGEGDCLTRLTSLLDQVPAAHDPALAHLVSMIQLRAEIETLRQVRRVNPD